MSINWFNKLVPAVLPVLALAGCAPPLQTYAPPYAPAYTANSSVVGSIQVELIRMHYLPDRPDGVLGPRTTDAIRSWQSAHGLPPDGGASLDLLAQMQHTSF